MAADITIEVDVLERFRDSTGVNYEVSIDWVDTILPGGAIDPDGVEIVVECARKDKPEAIRDKIRQAAITELQTNWGFGTLGFDNVRVEGYANEGKNVTLSPTGAQAPWYGGRGFRPNIPNKNGNTRLISEVKVTCFFDSTLNPDQKETSMTPIVYFPDPPTLAKLQYWILGFTLTGAQIWSAILPKVGDDCTAVFDLTAIGQAALWSTGNVSFVLGLKRTAGGQDVNANASGKIGRAHIRFGQ